MNDYTQLPLPFPPETIEIPLSQRGKYAGMYTAIVDAIDADLANHAWSVLTTDKHNSEYALRTDVSNGRKTVRLHRVIMERMLGKPIPSNVEIDHINGNGLDNRRGNLRLASKSQNSKNRPLYANNTSGYKGVSWAKTVKKWRAEIRVNGQGIYLGIFDTPEEAHAAYCEAAKKYHGEFANFGNE